jgi:hypothetical protein
MSPSSGRTRPAQPIGVDEIHAGVRRLVEDPKGLSFVGLFAERRPAVWVVDQLRMKAPPHEAATEVWGGAGPT